MAIYPAIKFYFIFMLCQVIIAEQKGVRLRKKVRDKLQSFPNFYRSVSDLQIEQEGLQKPEEFLEISPQIAPNTKGQHEGKSAAHAQHVLELAASRAELYSTDDIFASGDPTKRVNAQTHNLPAFLFTADITKIQSNAKNIEHDTGRNFFYERNIITAPYMPNEKVQQNIIKGDNSRGVSKEKLRRISHQRRQLLKQFKQRAHKRHGHAKHPPQMNAESR